MSDYNDWLNLEWNDGSNNKQPNTTPVYPLPYPNTYAESTDTQPAGTTRYGPDMFNNNPASSFWGGMNPITGQYSGGYGLPAINTGLNAINTILGYGALRDQTDLATDANRRAQEQFQMTRDAALADAELRYNQLKRMGAIGGDTGINADDFKKRLGLV